LGLFSFTVYAVLAIDSVGNIADNHHLLASKGPTMSENTAPAAVEVTAAAAVEVTAAAAVEVTEPRDYGQVTNPVKNRPWADFKTVSGVSIFTRPRLVNGKEDGWPEFCVSSEDGKPDEGWVNLYSEMAVARAKRVGAERKAAKAAERLKKLAAKEAAAGPSETDKLRVEMSALTAALNELAAKVAVLEAAKSA